VSRVGILTFSDGRDFVHQGVAEFATDVEGRIAAACEAFGAEVVRGTEPITSNTMAVREARRLAAHDPTSPSSTTRCGRGRTFPSTPHTPPLVPCFCSPTFDPTYPGMVGMLAAGGSLDQLGRRHERLWGDVEEGTVATRLKATGSCAAHGGHVVARFHLRPCRRSLHGDVHGGRRTDEWMRRFGIDVEEVDQYEIVAGPSSSPLIRLWPGGSGWRRTQRASTTTARSSPPRSSSARSVRTTPCARSSRRARSTSAGSRASPS